jgi:dTDP-glucose 4,6-dehydratase
VDIVLKNGKSGEIYNISSGNEVTNIEIAKKILNYLKKPESLLTFVEDRPGHDVRYSLDSKKIYTELCWKPNTTFEDDLGLTIEWYIRNERWWTPLASNAFLYSTPWKLEGLHRSF